ncbi:ribbon-helix-helix domain-containing protein [Sandaracinobacteroides saxicola]|uniref:Type II toxin-antitoxin system ParD family antitoxin n=1 Tax=Sandaracinobacteroides saxicola TaxID=2759707 RepID=A0A7G5IET5_9SPHN|nr:type II toxin-antitoxin system ParD family antitoxin [Sandaracinobacteroides saxicola]QMW21877.1 type II toxin-antitoxin system ParD family antitoxin [Sandaracinobacteroides saxicola]
MAARTITVSLGDMAERAAARVRSGDYASTSEVIRAGLRALDREEEALTHIWREKIAESLADPRPPVPIEEVRRRVNAQIAALRAAQVA